MSKQICSRAVGVAFIGALLALIIVGGGLATAAPTQTIKLKDNFFAPSTKSLKRGTTVRFKWAGVNPHNVVKASGPGGRFASRTTWRQGVNFAREFKKVGNYRLVCTVHSGMELNLTVIP